MGTHRHRLIGSSLATAAALLAGASVASAQNLLANPEFDDFDPAEGPLDHFPGWRSRTVEPTEGEDADGCSDSASHRQDANSQSTGVISTTCVPVTPSETIHLEVTYRSSLPFEIRLLQSPNLDCTQTPIPIPLPPPDIPANAGWTTVREQQTLAPTTHTVLLWLRGAGEGSYFLQFDRAYLGRAERVFADDFEGGFYCRWDVVETPAQI